jgi:hypothetical protein
MRSGKNVIDVDEQMSCSTHDRCAEEPPMWGDPVAQTASRTTFQPCRELIPSALTIHIEIGSSS